MDDKTKHQRKSSCVGRCYIDPMILLIVLIGAINCQPSKILFNSSYYLPSQTDSIFIQMNQTQLNLLNNGTMKLLEIQVKIQILHTNETYVDSPFETANILVKYWKNSQNTQATNVLTYSYEKLSSTKQFPTAIDSADSGRVDVESLYNYENEHNFLHIMGNQTSNILFVLGVYRFANYQLTDIFGMSKRKDDIKITVTVFKGSQSDICPQFCSSKTFCPANSCFCSQQLYSGCNVKRKNLTPNIKDSPQANNIESISKGEIKYIQINPQSNGKQWFPIQLNVSLQNSIASATQTPKEDRIFIVIYLQNKNETIQKIPNIYNFYLIDSPSIDNVISTQSSNTGAVKIVNSQLLNVKSNKNDSIQMTEKILLSNAQIIICAIYYLNDTNGSSNQNNNLLTIFMNTDFTSYQSKSSQSVLNLALIIGMVALGLFVLILLICLLHFVVAKRFRFWDVLNNHVENSNRNSANSARLSRNGNNQDRTLQLPTVSYDFLNDLVFKPLKYIYSANLKQNSSKITQNSNKKMLQHNEICSICLQQFTNQSKVKYTYCGHILDCSCLDSWLQKQMSCPMCRQKLQPQDISAYEDKILQEIVQNIYYQQIIDQEALAIKTMYKTWRSNRNKVNNNITIENTEQSLMNNEKVVFDKYIQNSIMPNFEITDEFQRTDMNIKLNTNNNNNKKIEQHVQNALSARTENPVNNLNRIFLNNQLFSVKRFGKNYLFYRCIFLHLQINKNFDKNSELNLYQSDLQVEKDGSMLYQSKIQSEQKDVRQNINNVEKANQLQPQPIIVRHFHEIEQNKTTSINKSTTKKQQFNLSFNFNVDFLSPQRQLQNNNKSELYRDNNSNSQQQQIQKRKKEQQSNFSENSQQRKQLKNRRNKRVTMRQQMNQLQRQLEQNQQKQQNVKFSSDNESIIRFDELEEDQNLRYVQAPISIVSASKCDQNKSQSSKNCAINKTEVLVFSHRKRQPKIGQQTLKTLPHTVCLNQHLPNSYRKVSYAQQNEKSIKRSPVKKLNLENI